MEIRALDYYPIAASSCRTTPLTFKRVWRQTLAAARLFAASWCVSRFQPRWYQRWCGFQGFEEHGDKGDPVKPIGRFVNGYDTGDGDDWKQSMRCVVYSSPKGWRILQWVIQQHAAKGVDGVISGYWRSTGTWWGWIDHCRVAASGRRSVGGATVERCKWKSGQRRMQRTNARFDQGLCPLFKLTQWPLEENRSIR